MTPKEKASMLVLTYLSIIGHKMEEAKECALIAVDEILDVITSIYDYDFEKLNPFWEEVKQEINNL